MKDKNVAAILALVLGTIGVHKFYLGRIGVGLCYLLFSFTFIPMLLGLIDFFILALMDTDEFNRRYNGSNMLHGPGPVIVNMLPPQGGFHGSYGQPPYGYAPAPYAGGQQPPQQGYGQPQPQRPQITTADDLKVQLEKLNELRISGLLTEDEFQEQKRKLLNLM